MDTLFSILFVILWISIVLVAYSRFVIANEETLTQRTAILDAIHHFNKIKIIDGTYQMSDVDRNYNLFSQVNYTNHLLTFYLSYNPYDLYPKELKDFININ